MLAKSEIYNHKLNFQLVPNILTLCRILSLTNIFRFALKTLMMFVSFLKKGVSANVSGTSQMQLQRLNCSWRMLPLNYNSTYYISIWQTKRTQNGKQRNHKLVLLKQCVTQRRDENQIIKGMVGLVGILSILNLRECGMCCHQNKPGTR